MIKIAVPVKDQTLQFFGNAGHTPNFAIFEMVGSGMFRSFKLLEIIPNPRNDIDHHHDDEHHECNHDHNDAEHIAQHNKMGEALNGCNYLVSKRACKNTANAMKAYSIKIVKYSGSGSQVEAILKEVASHFIG
jgi:predicted Fe-Mo cluster-binding NifX family protein